jgi:plasmid stabilization system protein ParE
LPKLVLFVRHTEGFSEGLRVPRALREIDEAPEWLSAHSWAVAARWYEQLTEAIRSLENNPERGGLAPESGWYPGELRQPLHGKKRGVYRVLFEVRGEAVCALRVRHSARALLDPEEL